jgi:hypothetical protein
VKCESNKRTENGKPTGEQQRFATEQRHKKKQVKEVMGAANAFPLQHSMPTHIVTNQLELDLRCLDPPVAL